MADGFQFKFEAIGTSWVIDIYGKKLVDFPNLREKIYREIINFSYIFSRFDPESELSKASNSARKIKIPARYSELIKLYERLYKLTEKKFTPLVGNLLVDAGYDASYSLKPGKLQPVADWDEVINFSGPFLEIKKPWVLDFGAGGKGFLIDLIGKLLEASGINSYCIDGGGDILYKGKEKLRVGLEHPNNLEQVIGIAEIKNQSICGSAGNRRKWRDFHHIFNPQTLSSVNEVLAVWVVAEKALLADCLSTCLFLVEPDTLKEFEFEYLIVYPDYSFKKSSKFPGEIYYN